MLNLQAKLKKKVPLLTNFPTPTSSLNNLNLLVFSSILVKKRKEMHWKKKMKYILKTIFNPIFMACRSGCGSTVRPSSHSHYTPGLPVSPTVLRSPCPKIDESVAMAKESNNPFEDYKKSMNQMIEERYIETEDDLKELLRCFLDINPSPQHNLIVRAFVDVCSHLRPPHDRRGKSLGKLLRLYVNNPLDKNNDDDEDDLHPTSSCDMRMKN
ncbi:PREDICTED: LOW QUALITY PROTEIN: transcription repressor OFP10 [Camelina sativa]|uniref:Transcription repressor n=1 Tax=Camelina sativa TaxID=90675 RepID=A0ABM0T541_CAMSA|nr:PREDICTED: LOW QUALITY PROTEIN: transcription repressor OFP10 [Camelina sativa]